MKSRHTRADCKPSEQAPNPPKEQDRGASETTSPLPGVKHPRGSGWTGLMGQGQWCEVQPGQGLGLALGSHQPHAALQAWGGAAGELPGGEGPGGAGWQPAEQEPAVCPGGQEGQQQPGLDQQWGGQREQGGALGAVSSAGLPSSRKMRSYWRESSAGLRG